MVHAAEIPQAFLGGGKPKKPPETLFFTVDTRREFLAAARLQTGRMLRARNPNFLMINEHTKEMIVEENSGVFYDADDQKTGYHKSEILSARCIERIKTFYPGAQPWPAPTPVEPEQPEPTGKKGK